MDQLWLSQVPSLPVHDSLIVPVSATAAAKDAILEVYRKVVDVTPVVVVS